MRRVRAGGGGGLWDAPGGRQTRTNARPHAIKFGRDREVAILSSSGPREQNDDSRRGRAPKRADGGAAGAGSSASGVMARRPDKPRIATDCAVV
ncbi:unnamed protein product [Pelagomonas calceolata]|uniref:Uncharacterized protein n=1 Tax=Pelagomonas calceolata TaxID=35677 RepID=A0A8J2WZL7_9STRA|nr:unnamed protein product [Pelagomonas calceolata]